MERFMNDCNKLKVWLPTSPQTSYVCDLASRDLVYINNIYIIYNQAIITIYL
jgi:hypothetical protein